MIKKTKKIKKNKFRLIILLICAIITFSYFLYTLISNVYEIKQKVDESEKLNLEYSDKLSEEEELKKEIEKLKDSEYLSRYTREKYFYSKDDEIIIKIEE